jgi:small subunit ribosomal protein S16
MLRIRLSRVGKKNKAQFRITVADARRAPTGKFIEILGHYNPHTKEKVFNKEKIEYWISKGAKPSSTVHNFLVDAGVIKAEKVISWKPKKKEGKKEEGKEEGKAEEKKGEKDTNTDGEQEKGNVEVEKEVEPKSEGKNDK